MKKSKKQRIAQEIVTQLTQQGCAATTYTPGAELPFLSIWKPVLNQLRTLQPDILTCSESGQQVWVKIAWSRSSLTNEQKAAIVCLEQQRNIAVCVASTDYEFFDWLNRRQPAADNLLPE